MVPATAAILHFICTLAANAAAAALKLSDFLGAKAACEQVLAADETNGKALFRMAQVKKYSLARRKSRMQQQ